MAIASQFPQCSKPVWLHIRPGAWSLYSWLLITTVWKVNSKLSIEDMYVVWYFRVKTKVSFNKISFLFYRVSDSRLKTNESSIDQCRWQGRDQTSGEGRDYASKTGQTWSQNFYWTPFISCHWCWTPFISDWLDVGHSSFQNDLMLDTLHFRMTLMLDTPHFRIALMLDTLHFRIALMLDTLHFRMTLILDMDTLHLRMITCLPVVGGWYLPQWDCLNQSRGAEIPNISH